MEKVKIKIKTISGKVPLYETEGASGMDLKAFLTEAITLEPGERALVPTGIHIQLPIGYEAQIRGRSGLAARSGIGLVNGIGTIDSDYRGEIKVILINWGEETFVIENGERVAQMVVSKFEKVEFEITEELDTTQRNQGGFGHTGKK